MVRRPRFAINYRLWIGVVLLIIVLGACSQTPDQTQIQQQLDEIIEAIEARQSRDVLGKLAEQFSGPNNQNKRETYQLMVGSFLRYKNVKVIRTGIPNINMQDQYATVSFDVALTGGDGFIPEHLRQYAVTTGWQKIDHEWLILQANWVAK